ncbi:MAG: hypothetical protein VKL39_02650 [Leptolyngbyaceae bacterium]|nr:hypothetical protein [Leptolyngbyaceae bacterium]
MGKHTNYASDPGIQGITIKETRGMGRFHIKLHRTFVHPISKWVGSAVDELSGRGQKRRCQSLEVALIEACEQRDRLQAEMKDLIQYTDAELANLTQANEQLHRERDALQLQVWTLEEQIKILTQLNEDVNEEQPSDGEEGRPGVAVHVISLENESAGNESESSTTTGKSKAGSSSKKSSSQKQDEADAALSGLSCPSIDLSGLRLALVGGHPSTRRGVIQELQLNYGLRYWVEVPRMNEVNTNRSKVKSKIGQCTLVVLITGYMSHRLTEIIFSLKEAGSLAGDVLQLNCKGKSGVIREILNHVGHVSG